MHESNEREREVRFRVRTRDDWELSEEPVPESRAHDLTVELIRDLLAYWARTARPLAQVGSNLAVRWDRDRPSVGVDPDVYVVDPAPPEGDDVTSLRLWEPGHRAPLVAVEVVSPNHPTKDYAVAHAKYAASGTAELWVFDPLLAGPAAHGPHRVQMWARDASGGLTRVYAGDGPVWSVAVGGWLVPAQDGARLRIATNPDGTCSWLTAEEAERAAKETERAAKETERAAKETERAAKETERAAKEAALARVAELEALLVTRR